MSDHLDRAAAIVGGCCAHCDDLVDERLALLDEAGMLVSPEHDAEVAAKALREAEGDYSHLYQTRGPAATAVAAVTCAALRDRADRIEREAGESDADA